MLAIAVVMPLVVPSVSFTTNASAATTAVTQNGFASNISNKDVDQFKSLKTDAEIQAWRKSHEVPKTALPKDPRGPLPNFKSVAEAEKWFKDHPDPELKKQSTSQPQASDTLVAGIKYVPFYLMEHGDLIFGHGPFSSSSGSFSYGYFRHTSMWDDDKENFISAQMDSGVCRERTDKWQMQYTEISLDYVSSVTAAQKAMVVENASYHEGEPYQFTSKSYTNSWYCSKLSWFEYNKWGGVDIDKDGGYLVTPDDEYYSDYVHQYWRG